MSVSLDNRLLVEPNVDGVTRTGAPSWFAPHDDAPLGYWQKPTDGTVFLAQYGENGLDAKLKRKFTRLDQYGEFASAGSRTWDPMNDPLYPLVMKGGIRELPAAQVKELGWHREPSRDARASHRAVEELVRRAMADRSITRDEALLVVMPQLRGFDLTDWTCVSHPGRFFPSEGAKVNHDAVMHKEAIQSESIGRAVASANGGAGTDALVTLIAQQGDVIAQQQAAIADLRARFEKAARYDPEREAAAYAENARQSEALLAEIEDENDLPGRPAKRGK